MASYEGTYPLIGRKVVYIGNEEFSSDLVADEIGSVTVTPATTETKSQRGTVKIPNGSFDEISAVIKLIIPDVQTLARVFPNLYKEATFTYTGQTEKTGQVQFGGVNCATNTAVPVVIHPECLDNSSQDVQIPKAIIAVGGTFTFNLGDPITLELQITPLTTDAGAIIIGEGLLSSESVYDTATAAYKAKPAA